MNFNFTANKRLNYFGRHASPIDHRGHQSSRKSVYEVVYDKTTLSTITKRKGVVYTKKLKSSGLRNQSSNR